MATLAPSSAKRTAIACPMPELPPVTSTFLPWMPRKVSRAGAVVVSVAAIGSSPRSLVRVALSVPRRAAPLHVCRSREREPGGHPAGLPCAFPGGCCRRVRRMLCGARRDVRGCGGSSRHGRVRGVGGVADGRSRAGARVRQQLLRVRQLLERQRLQELGGGAHPA